MGSDGMTTFPPRDAPFLLVLMLITSNAGSIPAEGITADFSSVTRPTDGEHVVQKFGPELLIEATNIVAQPFFEYSRCEWVPPQRRAQLSLSSSL